MRLIFLCLWSTFPKRYYEKNRENLVKALTIWKPRWSASKYVEKTLKLLGQNPEPILIERLIIQASFMGRFNPLNSPVST